MSHLYDGQLPGMAPSPTSTVSEDARRSSGGLSLPPQSASDLDRGVNKTRPSYLTHLTQAQRDAWDRHQAVRAGSYTHSAGGSVNTSSNANAATLFGGVDSLVEESQDWWLKDQSALALGFDNWIDANTDWAGLGLSSTFGTGDNAASEFNGNDVSTMSAVPNANLAGYPYSDALRKSGIVWNEQLLLKWLENPDALVKDNDMEYSVPNAAERGILVAYLKSLTN